MILSKRGMNPNNKIAINKINYSNRVMLFTNVRDEKNMKEWVAHHLLLNFDLIYIFDHKSIVPLKNEFKNFSKRVIIERGEWANPVKMLLMKRAVSIATKMGMDWMLYLDADEYLVLNNCSNVKQFLYRHNFAHAIGVNWLMFGTNYHRKEPAGLVLENYTKSELYVDEHVKTFVRPEYVVNVTNPHCYQVAFANRIFSANMKRLPNNSPFNKCRVEYHKIPAYIAHHIYQSQETYINRKIKIPRDDSTSHRVIDNQIHTRYNNVDNHSVKNKYVDAIKKLLEFLNNRQQNILRNH